MSIDKQLKPELVKFFESFSVVMPRKKMYEFRELSYLVKVIRCARTTFEYDRREGLPVG